MGIVASAKAILEGTPKQYLFPASTKFRDLWKGKPPSKYVKAGSDYVKYHAVPNEGEKPSMNPSHSQAACYASCRRGIGFNNFDITCMPLQKKGVISLDEAWDFFLSFTEVGVFAEGIQLWEEKDGVHCHMPAGIGNPHNVYAALVAYRLIDSCPPLIWEYLNIMSQEGKRHPLQVFPYLVAKYSIGGGHCFMNVNTYGSGVVGSATNPVMGLAAKIYFNDADKRGKKDYDNHSTYVNTAIGAVAAEITPTIKVKSGKEGWAPTVNTPKFILEKPEDGLHPDLYEMYTIPKITNKQIEEFLSERFTQEKK
jgi:hypothetical protein